MWSCDACAQAIQRPEDGWVEWLIEGDQHMVPGSLRLVHSAVSSPRQPKGTCQYIEKAEWSAGKRTVRDRAATGYLTPQGLALALGQLQRGDWPVDEGVAMIARLKDLPDLE